VSKALLLLAHGTPERAEDVPEYLGYVTGGRALPPHVVAEICSRYRQIGSSPLTAITAQLAEAVQKALGSEWRVYFAMRNWHPFIGDVVVRMKAEGVTEAAVVCLAPQNSRTSVGLYRRAVEAAVAGEIRLDFTPEWHSERGLIAGFQRKLIEAWQRLTAEVGETVPVLFTAHSVPVRTLQATENQPADNYDQQARETAELVAAALPESTWWEFAFQSQGQSGGEWIGPRVEAKLAEIAATGAKTVLVAPIGFLCDHVEILYDIDIFFRDEAAKLGLRLERTGSLNEAAELVDAIVSIAGRSFSGEVNP